MTWTDELCAHFNDKSLLMNDGSSYSLPMIRLKLEFPSSCTVPDTCQQFRAVAFFSKFLDDASLDEALMYLD